MGIDILSTLEDIKIMDMIDMREREALLLYRWYRKKFNESVWTAAMGTEGIEVGRRKNIKKGIG